MKRFYLTSIVSLLIVVLSIPLFLAACKNDNDEPKAAQETAKKTETLMQEANREVGLPNISNFREKKLAKQIYELRDKQDLPTYTYIKSEYEGKLVFLGNSVGFGLPYSVQYSNPERVAHQDHYQGGSFGTLPQPEPNGLYPASGLSATWVMLSNSEGEVEPTYVEPSILVTQSKLPARLIQNWSLPENY